MAGYPSERATLAAVRGLIQGGTDIIELGFPFSDPIADGPTIQMASTESLNNGTKIDNFFAIVKKIRKESDIPLVLMTYTNILYNQTYQKLGVCLGHQGIISCFGGKVVNADNIRHGKTSQVKHTDESLFEGVKNPFRATRYHSLVGQKTIIPDSLKITAVAEDDGEVMGVPG